ncbi:unnamed protein product [Cylicostephanus goldi]|uniref:AMP-dependent synthetase/ligase domain-containing protein n=1 Tax=Cylicostephanus goldi TaxID=71465 RepID=A0A3P6S9N4_CYLGO|nr:unnamed protein product [Cylicostephanus goldi]
MLTHGSLAANAEALVHAWRFKQNDKLLHMLPFYHVHGMFISLNCSIFSHSTVVWREQFSIGDCLKWLPSSTVMMGVPTYYRYSPLSCEESGHISKEDANAILSSLERALGAERNMIAFRSA